MFGCLCFVHVPQAKRDKLDKKAISGIFVGYSTVSKAYKVYHPQKRKMIITRDVHFVRMNNGIRVILKKTYGFLREVNIPFEDHNEQQEEWLNEREDDPPV